MQATTSSLYLFVLVALVSNFKPCVSGETVALSSLLQDNGTTIVSAGKSFELGFFNPEDKINAERYVGIWYYNLSPRTIVWIANRDNPLLGGTGFFAIVDGNLKLLDENGSSYFHTNLESSSYPNRTLKLLDSGNLALIDGLSGNYLWQSFEEPTDTFLPGMKMDENSKLVSWMDSGDPRTGNYTFQQNEEDNTVYMIMERTILYWRSDAPGSGELENIVTFMLSNFRRGDKPATDISSNKLGFINYASLRNACIFNYSNTRLVMNSSGEIQFYRQQQHGWSLIWSEPHDACAVNDPCGNFGVCNLKNTDLACECLPGFAAVYPDRWKDGDFTGGCERKSAICNKTSKPDIFLNLKFMKVGKPDFSLAEVKGEEQCRYLCFNNCRTKCQAYYYAGTNSNQRRLSNRTAEAKCSIWTSDPNNLQEYYDGGHNLSIRVAVAAIGSTSRDCESCGKFIIPYPLSTGPSCGDPSYYSFSCNDSTGQLFFSTMNNSYEVIDINKEEQRFVIQVNRRGAENCGARTSVESLQLNQSLPFNVTNWCYNKLLTFNYKRSIQGGQRIEISWKSPLEPICHSSNDCEDWPHSNCSASKRCLCNPNYHWDNQALMCKSADDLSTSPNFAKPSTSKNHEAIIIFTTVIAVVLVAGSFSCFLYRRRILAKMEERKGSTTGNPVPPMDDSEGKSNEMVVEDDKIVDVPYFSLESVLAATDNFSDASKLGQGGFGPVYKGIFPGEKEIAIKRLSSHSGQGVVEFRNEVVLIAKLQHRNLVRLLGYCIKGSEKILLYEYMPNKSLDTFIFDQERCRLLDWNRRSDIILGIARGLLYLHQDSRLRIIHRDLKTSNILLDEEMSPKISDFGLARIVEGRETEANTMTIVGTYGYMSPEYAIEGLFSTKSDVFSFGVILLEIISGKRNTGYYQSKEALSLLGYAWKLWQGRNAMDLIDKKILESCNGTEVMKCINIGLLCVDEDPSNRPTMSNVITMLTSETTTLPSPNQPAFVVRRRTSGTSTSLTSKEETKSINEMTISVEEGR